MSPTARHTTPRLALALGLVASSAAAADPTPSSAPASTGAPTPLTASVAPAPAPSAAADPTASATASAAPPPAPTVAPERAWSSCVEYVPEGAIRPKVEAHFPPNGLSGYALELVVVVTHGRGETVLPAGFRIDRGSDAMRAIEGAGFRIPDPQGGSKPLVDRPADADREAADKKTLTTTIRLPFVALPEKPGRHALRLPPLPIAVGRANGQMMTVCTAGLPITIEDPIANEAEPEVAKNAPPRSQREEWTVAKHLTLAALAVIALAVLGAMLLARWSRRPRPEPEKPRVPPWVTALEELAAIRASRLVEEGQLDVFVDRVNDCVRRYLGDRFGFDGLESTTEEIRQLLGRIGWHGIDRRAVEGFLDDCDLVKFAKFTPQPDDCAHVIARAETIVRSTMPSRAARAEEAT